MTSEKASETDPDVATGDETEASQPEAEIGEETDAPVSVTKITAEENVTPEETETMTIGNDTDEQTPSVKDTLHSILGESIEKDDELTAQGLANLDTLPAFDSPPPAVQGKEFSPGLMGFRRSGGNLKLAIACGKAQIRYIELPKFIAMVENLNDHESATVVLQNFQDQSDYKAARGQVLGRINAASSAITVIQGVTGRVVRSPADIALFDAYYIDRRDLAVFYLAAKAQISNADQMETLIASFDGWKAFEVPLNPLAPYGD